jgi:hypothetical protein
VSLFLRADQTAALRAVVNAETSIPVAVLIRKRLDWLLTRDGKTPATARRGAR